MVMLISLLHSLPAPNLLLPTYKSLFANWGLSVTSHFHPYYLQMKRVANNLPLRRLLRALKERIFQRLSPSPAAPPLMINKRKLDLPLKASSYTFSLRRGRLIKAMQNYKATSPWILSPQNTY